MPLGKVLSAEGAVALIRDGDTVATTGYGGNGTPDGLVLELERRFLDTGSPRGLTLVHAGGQGDGKERGLNHLGHEGLLKRVIDGYYVRAPRIERLALDGKIEAYNLPQGVIVRLYREIGARKPGVLFRVGLGMFVDPRLRGGKVNAATREDIVEVCTLGGEERLFYKAFPIQVAFIRGTTASPDGNVTLESVPVLLMDERKIIARRAAIELRAGSVVNLGIGMPGNVGVVANEERISDLMTLTVDPGVIGGEPMGGLDSRFSGRLVGCGVIIDISQQSKSRVHRVIHRRRPQGRGRQGQAQHRPPGQASEVHRGDGRAHVQRPGRVR